MKGVRAVVSPSQQRSLGSVVCHFLILRVLYKYCGKQILHCRAVPPNCSAQSPDTASASCINQSIKGRGAEMEVDRAGPASSTHAMGLCSSCLERTKPQQCPAPARQKRSHQSAGLSERQRDVVLEVTAPLSVLTHTAGPG